MSRSSAATRVNQGGNRRQPASRSDRASDSRLRGVLAHPLFNYGALLATTLTLQAIGLIMVMSASTVYSLKATKSETGYLFFNRQLMFAVIGIVLMLLASRMPAKFFQRLAFPALIVSGALLVLVLVPGIGKNVNGQQNWIALGGPFRLQPSEIAKIVLIIWVAALLARRHDRVDGWRTLLLPLAPVTGIFVLLILLEGDLGTDLVIMPIIAMMLLIVGAPLKLFGWIGAGVVALIGLMSVTTPYRLRRFQVWLDPQQDPTGVGWQVIHGQFALATGGWWGVGLGASREKWGFLPEAQTDFIFAVLGEELGLVGTLSVLLLFATMGILIARIAIRAETVFARLAAAGVGVWLISQALINIGAVLGVLPITGLPLPLISYGGSSLTFTLIAVGMVLAFARQEPRAAEYLAMKKQRRDSRPENRVRSHTSSGKSIDLRSPSRVKATSGSPQPRRRR